MEERSRGQIRGPRPHLCTAEAGVSSPAATWIRNILRSLQSIGITPRVPRVQCVPCVQCVPRVPAPVGGVGVAAVHEEVAEHQHVPRPRRHGRRGLQAPGRLVHVVVTRAGRHVPLHGSRVTFYVSRVTSPGDPAGGCRGTRRGRRWWGRCGRGGRRQPSWSGAGRGSSGSPGGWGRAPPPRRA